MAKSLNDKLPLYSPPESVWENIEQGLNDAPLQQALSQLPTYEPPVQTWFDMAEQLPQPQQTAIHDPHPRFHGARPSGV